MKFLMESVLCTLLVLEAATARDPEVVRKIHEECFKISHMPEETFKKIITGAIDLSDDVVKNHLFCYTKAIGFINEAGVLNDDFIAKRLSLQVKDKEKVEGDVKICNAPKTSDEEVNYFAAKVVACYYNRNPGITIL